MLVSSISPLPSNTVCKVHRTAYMSEQIAVFQNCFGSLESTFCITENTSILQSIWPTVYEGGECQRCPANVFSFKSQRSSPLVTRQSLNEQRNSRIIIIRKTGKMCWNSLKYLITTSGNSWFMTTSPYCWYIHIHFAALVWARHCGTHHWQTCLCIVVAPFILTAGGGSFS